MAPVPHSLSLASVSQDVPLSSAHDRWRHMLSLSFDSLHGAPWDPCLISTGSAPESLAQDVHP